MEKLSVAFIAILALPMVSFADYQMALDSYNSGDYRPAFKEFLSQAKLGDIKSNRMIINMYEEGRGTIKNDEQAFLWLKKLVDSGNASETELIEFANKYAKGIGTNEDENAAVTVLQSPVLDKNPNAKYALAEIYMNSQSMNNVNKAVELYKIAAESGSDKAQFLLAGLYYKGGIISKDLVEAAKWYETLSNKNNSDAQFALAYMYHNGEGVEKNPKKALELYEKSANQDNFPSQKMLASVYYNGNIVPINYKQAIYWAEKSSLKGDDMSSFILGDIYFNGKGVEVDYDKAVNYLSKSADLDNSNAQYLLGKIYMDGIGVYKDYKKAANYILSSSEQGNIEAQLALLSIYLSGKGFEFNAEEAYFWHNIISNKIKSKLVFIRSSQSSKEEKEKLEKVLADFDENFKGIADNIEKGLTTNQVNRLQQRSMSWSPRGKNTLIERKMKSIGRNVKSFLSD